MTAVATKVPSAVIEWTKIFPKQMTESYTSSVTFMKQLTVVAISTITYLKNAFPEDSYTLEHFGGLKLRILKKKCRDEVAHFISTSLAQAFEAFDKKYLHQLALCFYEDDCKVENLIEYHVFEYSYNKGEISMSVHSKTRDSEKRTTKFTFENIRERTVHLIRACVVIMQTTQQTLPDCCDVSLRLYYNKDAPEDYQAPGFSTPTDEDHLEPTACDAIKLGFVETPFHRLVVSTYIRDNVVASSEAIPSQNPPKMTQMEEDFANRTDSSKSVSECASEDFPLRCPCNKTDVADGETLLTCQYCGRQQHAVCFGVRDVRSVEAHCCSACADAGVRRTPTDPRLAALSLKKRECLCIFRRTLEWCNQNPSVSASQLMDRFTISDVNASKLMKLLYSHGVIADDPGSDSVTPRKIIPEQLKHVMAKFFQTPEGDIVDRLLAETFASQETDPVGDVLEPMEKVSLHNATNLGQVIDNPYRPPTVEDSTLAQYREAVLSNYPAQEELPNPVKEIENLGKKNTNKRKLGTEERSRLRSGMKTKRAKING